MLPRPPESDDYASEEEALVDTYRFRLVASRENLNGGVGFDDRGQARWKWITEGGGIDDSGTFEQLKALENPELSLEEPEAPAVPEPSRTTGYDPYATGVFEKPKRRR